MSREQVITFMSSANTNEYPSNSVNNFRNLVDPYLFYHNRRTNPGDLQISLINAYIPTNFNNITEGLIRLTPSQDGANEDGAGETDASGDEAASTSSPDAVVRPIVIQIDTGYYDSISKIVTKIMQSFMGKTKQLSDDKKSAMVEITMDKATNRITLVFRHTANGLKFDVHFSQDIARILGLPAEGYIACPPLSGRSRKLSAYEAPYHATIVGGNTELLIYCSCVRPMHIANRQVNLLAILPWQPRSDMLYTTQYIAQQQVIWHDIVSEDFADIQFYVCDPSGRPVDLFGANLMLTCMTRRRPSDADKSKKLYVK